MNFAKLQILRVGEVGEMRKKNRVVHFIVGQPYSTYPKWIDYFLTIGPT